MTEANLDLYMTKIAEIETACELATTTKTQIETLLTALNTLSDAIDADLLVIAVPTSIVHLQKLMIVNVVRITKLDLHASLTNLKDCRKNNVDTYANTNTYADLVTYTSDNKTVHDYIDNSVIPACHCLKGLRQIIRGTDKK